MTKYGVCGITYNAPDKPKAPKTVAYWNENFERWPGEYVERNGNLHLVYDAESGKPEYLTAGEIDWSTAEFY